MRKALIILIAFAVSILAYWAYLQLSGSTTLDPPGVMSGPEPQLPETTEPGRQIGATTIHGAEQSRYVYLDPETKDVQRVFGFAELKTDRQSARWQVERPYMIFYEEGLQYRIDADSGLFQIERAGGSVSPTDAQLEGNVVIHLTPRPGGRIAEMTLHLDDLLFSSERTEISTDGPVQLTSAQVEMIGRGLVLLFNAEEESVDYLHILDLEVLRLSNVVRDQRPTAAADTPPPTAAPDQSRPTPRGPLYQCVIEDNVKIRYGDRIVVSGAEQVNIQNILGSGRRAASTDEKSQADDRPAQPGAAAVADAPRSDDGDSVVITCDGGIVLRQMPTDPEETDRAAMAIAMNGTPLRIEQVDADAPEVVSPIAHCAMLHYDLHTDIVKLFTDGGVEDILLGGGSAGHIRTEGPVVWDRRAKQAQVVGPGTLYLNADDSADSGQIAFNGQMELVFADSPQQDAAMQLTSLNLTGGMNAMLRGSGRLAAAADAAYLVFGPDNTLDTAWLEGAVRFDNDDSDAPANATAQTAMLYFADGRQLSSAELAGDVRLGDAAGRLRTESAIIGFAPDENGAIAPSHFKSETHAAFETRHDSPHQPPTRFEARAISYDLLTGSGHAAGPVRFVFHQPAQSDDATTYWPVEITADGDTAFIAAADRRIETVTFTQNVIGARTQTLDAFTQVDAFGADTMIVGLGRGQLDADEIDIEHITLRDGFVYAESKRTHETRTLAHTRLICERIDYDRRTENIVATGPGEIEVDNSQAEPTAEARGLDLRGPSFAMLKGFDRIGWDATQRQLTAEADTELIELAYFPLTDGTPDTDIRAAAGRVEMNFADSADGRMELATLHALDRVYFTETGKHTLNGHAMAYNADADGWLSITGTEQSPCFVDGTQVPYIHYNLITGDLETRLSTVPGAVPVP